jgi:uncharacterized protein
MITSCFSILPGIGRSREKSIHAEGVTSWVRFLEKERVRGISLGRKKYYDRILLRLTRALQQFDARTLNERISQKEMHLLYSHFREDALFLDIETSGTGKRSYITVIGMYDGQNTKTLVQGINLYADTLYREIRKYKMIVTFNGACFDLPFLERFYPGLTTNLLHFDVRFACQKLGLHGGLKQVEHDLSLRRPKIVDGMHGGDALTLWRMFKGSQDPYYLDLLVEYNNEDVINLLHVADYVARELCLTTTQCEEQSKPVLGEILSPNQQYVY